MLSNGLPSDVVQRTEAGLEEELQVNEVSRPSSTVTVVDGDILTTGGSIIYK